MAEHFPQGRRDQAVGLAARKLKQVLLSIARDLDMHYNNVRGVRVVGTAASLMGASVALIAAIPTLGLSLPIAAAIIGLGVSGVGAATAVGANVVGMIITSSKLKDAQTAWDQFAEALPAHDLPALSDNKALVLLVQTLKGGGGVAAFASALRVVGNGVAASLPVLNAIFMVVNVADLVSIIVSQSDRSPGMLLRNFVRDFLDQLIESQ